MFRIALEKSSHLLHSQWASWTNPVTPADVLPALCIPLLLWDDFLPSQCSHFSFTWMQCWHLSLGQRRGPEAQQAQTPFLLPSLSLLSSCLVTPAFSLSPPSQPTYRVQQLWTSYTGVPATRGDKAKVMPARTFSSSQLSWQHDPWAGENLGNSSMPHRKEKQSK